MSDEPPAESNFEMLWQDLLADAEATAEEYREDGWETHLLTPGDVTPRYDSEEPYGLDVLVPESEFELVDGLREETTFESSDVYAQTIGPIVFLLTAELTTGANTAVLVPAYFNHVNDADLLAAAAEGEGMRLHLRSLGSDHRVTFIHEDHTLFEPDHNGERQAEAAEAQTGDESEESGSGTPAPDDTE